MTPLAGGPAVARRSAISTVVPSRRSAGPFRAILRCLPALVFALLCAIVPAQHAGAAPAGPEPGELGQTTVGMRHRIRQFVIPGPELGGRAVADPQQADAIVRVLERYPHGPNIFRYDLEVTPLVAGPLDLREHLVRVDGEAVGELPEMILPVGAVLPDDRMEPNELGAGSPGFIGGYTLTMILLGIAWLVGLGLILFVGRRRRSGDDAGPQRRPPTLAERLRPLVERARDGALDDSGRAELERLILAHWRRRRALTDVGAGRAIQRLRDDEEAGPLLRQIEEWLHRPHDPSRAQVDVAALLEPYRNVAEVDESAVAGQPSNARETA